MQLRRTEEATGSKFARAVALGIDSLSAPTGTEAFVGGSRATTFQELQRALSDIDHGHIMPKEPRMLPLKGSALLRILNSTASLVSRPVGLLNVEFTAPNDFNTPLPEDVPNGFEVK